MESFSKRFRLVLRQILEDFIGKQISGYFRWNQRMSLRKEFTYVPIFVCCFWALLLLIVSDYASADGLTQKEGETMGSIGLIFGLCYYAAFLLHFFFVISLNVPRYFVVPFKKVKDSTLSERLDSVTKDIKEKIYGKRKNRFILLIMIKFGLILLLILTIGIGQIIQ